MTQFPIHGGRPFHSECLLLGEHQGDSYIQLTTEPVAVEAWTCCDETRVVGEVFDCDTCLEPGVATGAIPDNWTEDTNGLHCERCQQ